MKNLYLFGIAVLALAIIIADAMLFGTFGKETAKETLHVSIVSASTKKEWINAAVSEFNSRSKTNREFQVDGKRIAIEIIEEEIGPGVFDHYRSGTMVADILSGKIQPVAASPGEETWLRKLNGDWRAIHGKEIYTDKPEPLLETPVIIAAWQSRALALGCWPVASRECTWQHVAELSADQRGWGALGHPEWGKLKFGYGYVGESNSGTFAALMFCMSGLGKTTDVHFEDINVGNGCGQTLAKVETAKVHSGIKSEWLLGWMKEKGQTYLDAVVTNEQDVIEFNRKNAALLPEPLVVAYPQDGTVVRDDPYVVLNQAPWVSPQQARAARLFEDFLTSEPEQRDLLKWGLRPRQVSGSIEPIRDSKNGANLEASFVRVQVPDVPVFDRLDEVWHEVKKHAAIALVIDRSARMDRDKLESSKQGILTFLDGLDRDDYVIYVSFGDVVRSGPSGVIRDVGPDLRSKVNNDNEASGGAALLDAISQAYSELETLQKELGEGVRYGIVVESAGPDSRSKVSFTQLRNRLEARAGDPTGIQIHTVGIGKDAPRDRLAILAVHGKYWDATDVKRFESISEQIGKYY